MVKKKKNSKKIKPKKPKKSHVLSMINRILVRLGHGCLKLHFTIPDCELKHM